MHSYIGQQCSLIGNVGRLPELESGRRGLAVIGLLDAYVVATMWYRQKLEKLTAT